MACTVAEVLHAVGFSSAVHHCTRKSCEVRVIGQRTKLLSLLLGVDDLFKHLATTWWRMYEETFLPHYAA
jgi:hypothetical protein